jgi:transcription termination/antitermination protein NusA
MAVNKPRTEFALALNQICAEHDIEPEVALSSIKEAMLAAYRKDYGIEEGLEYEVDLNQETGESRIRSYKTEAPDKKTDVTPPDFGRIAAGIAKQVLLQKIREAEKKSILAEYSKRLSTLVSGMVLRFDGPNVIVDIGRAEAVMPPQEQVRQEQYHLNQKLTFLIKEIAETGKGEQVIVSRADSGLVEALFKREVPEVSSGAVEIRAIAREAGNRTKMAVYSRQTGVDPVGSCVGQKGVRVQSVIDELNEKIDIIQYNDDPKRFIVSALSPAENIDVELDETAKTAIANVPEDQLSLAIGKEGQNVRLAAKLTGYRIDIQQKGAKAAAAAAALAAAEPQKPAKTKKAKKTAAAEPKAKTTKTTKSKAKKTKTKVKEEQTMEASSKA